MRLIAYKNFKRALLRCLLVTFICLASLGTVMASLQQASNLEQSNSYASQSISQLQAAAAQGDLDAQVELGNRYCAGADVYQDYVQAFQLFSRAANRGHAWAQYYLGIMCQHGEGVDQDSKKAFYWIKKAAAQGLAIAQYDLGVMYQHGIGVEQDSQEAFHWVRKAAD